MGYGLVADAEDKKSKIFQVIIDLIIHKILISTKRQKIWIYFTC